MYPYFGPWQRAFYPIAYYPVATSIPCCSPYFSEFTEEKERYYRNYYDNMKTSELKENKMKMPENKKIEPNPVTIITNPNPNISNEPAKSNENIKSNEPVISNQPNVPNAPNMPNQPNVILPVEEKKTTFEEILKQIEANAPEIIMTLISLGLSIEAARELIMKIIKVTEKTKK